jgi:ribosomal protein S18 acetylase RimI-like enzyme
VIVFIVRQYSPKDLNRLVKIYQDCFAEPPWNETWSREEVIEDLDMAFAQKLPLVLIAEIREKLVGFIWGYQMPFEKFPFLEGKIPIKSSYGDEIAVEKEFRRNEVAKRLTREYMQEARNQGIEGFVVRTDVENKGSIPLLKSLGLDSLGIRDPEYPTREYFFRRIQ